MSQQEFKETMRALEESIKKSFSQRARLANMRKDSNVEKQVKQTVCLNANVRDTQELIEHLDYIYNKNFTIERIKETDDV